MPNFNQKEASVTVITEEEKIIDKKLQIMMMQMQNIMEKFIKIRKKWLQ